MTTRPAPLKLSPEAIDRLARVLARLLEDAQDDARRLREMRTLREGRR